MLSKLLSSSLAFCLLAPKLALSFVLPSSDLPAFAVQEAAQPHSYTAGDPLPVILWHGLGDSSDAQGLKDIAELITEVHPGTYVHLISAAEGDRQASWFGNLNDQVQYVCEQLAGDRILATVPAVDAIGFSQGGQFLRAYMQRCGGWAPKIRNLLTFGSQHNGIAEFQQCKGATDFVCHAANALLKGNAVWSDFVQTRLVPAQYYRNLNDYDNYLEHSNFLADINNERKEKNSTYAENLAKLEKFVMIVFKDDKTVIPRDSGWFAEVDAESGNTTYLQDREIYKQDWLGLKKLDKNGGLIFDTVSGEHMRLEEKDLVRLFKQYLGPASGKSTAADVQSPMVWDQDL